MMHEPRRPASERRDEAVRRAHRAARRMRWAVRGMLALAVLLGIVWVLSMRR